MESSKKILALLDHADLLCRLHLSIIPIRADGSKSPAIRWGLYQQRQPTNNELIRWFRTPGNGLAIIAGKVSGNLEIIDIDSADVASEYVSMMGAISPGLLEQCPRVRTPSGGMHVYYRCETIQGNQKLATRKDDHGRVKTLIETRGEGGYVLAPPSPPACHPRNAPYVWIGGDIAHLPVVSPDDREVLLNVARSFNEYVEPRLTTRTGRPRQDGTRFPGEDYNQRVSWEDVLTPHGWTNVKQRGRVSLWRRPGKSDPGCSATTNYAESDLLYVFSTNAEPFQADHAYSKFAAYTLLNHQGDFRRASKALRHQGYARFVGGTLRRRQDGVMVYCPGGVGDLSRGA